MNDEWSCLDGGHVGDGAVSLHRLELVETPFQFLQCLDGKPLLMLLIYNTHTHTHTHAHTSFPLLPIPIENPMVPQSSLFPTVASRNGVSLNIRLHHVRYDLMLPLCRRTGISVVTLYYVASINSYLQR